MKLTIPGLAFITLGLVLVYLKINGHIGISWTWALAPLWIPCVVSTILLTVFLVVWLLAVLVKVLSK